jgi:hypothetical protein
MITHLRTCSDISYLLRKILFFHQKSYITLSLNDRQHGLEIDLLVSRVQRPFGWPFDNELTAVLGADAIAYSTMTKYRRQRQFTSKSRLICFSRIPLRERCYTWAEHPIPQLPCLHSQSDCALRPIFTHHISVLRTYAIYSHCWPLNAFAILGGSPAQRNWPGAPLGLIRRETSYFRVFWWVWLDYVWNIELSHSQDRMDHAYHRLRLSGQTDHITLLLRRLRFWTQDSLRVEPSQSHRVRTPEPTTNESFLAEECSHVRDPEGPSSSPDGTDRGGATFESLSVPFCYGMILRIEMWKSYIVWWDTMK